MKFSSAPRKVFESDNYNPPPGYYIGNDRKENEVLQFVLPQSTQLVLSQGITFQRSDRFQEKMDAENQQNLNNYHAGFGFDKIAKFQSLKHQFELNKQNQANYVSQSQKFSRRKTVPPKKAAQNLLLQMDKFLSGQPLGNSMEGQKIQAKQQLLLQQLQIIQNETPGPGAYDAKINLTKPKVNTFQIKNNIYEDKTPIQTISSPIQNQLIWGRSLQQKYDNVVLNQSRKSSRRPSTGEPSVSRELKRRDLSFLKKQNEKRKIVYDNNQNKDFNLELLLTREKRVPKEQEVPPPGWYYTEEIFSQFGKLKEKEYKNQCFDTRQPRFNKENDNQKVPGPGEYEVVDIVNTKHVSIPKAEIKDPKFGAPVGVGEYQVSKTLVKKVINKETAYPAVFGSGQSRDLYTISTKDDTPGPGQYNISQKERRPPKYVYRTDQKNINQGNQDQNQLFGLAVTSNQETQQNVFDIVKKPIRKRQSKSAKGSHMFASNVKRFVPQDQISTNLEIGPGIYNVSTNVRTSTFNQSRDLFAKQNRKTTLSTTKMQTSKWVGPGSYEVVK